MGESGGLSRRDFVDRGVRAGAGLLAAALPAAMMGAASCSAMAPPRAGGSRAGMRFGLVTYLWGKDWDVPTLLRNLERTGLLGVELRVEHAHRVEPSLSARERAEVRSRFGDSPVELIGFGTNWAFHYPDPPRVSLEVESAKAHLRLSRDVGGGGVKVQPNALPEEVPSERTIEQIGRALNELARYGAELGQEVRLEVHGPRSAALPNMRRIVEAADHPNARICWNSLPTDLEGAGLAANLAMVRGWFGRTLHVHQLDLGDYPYEELVELLVASEYDGWVLLEGLTMPADPVAAMEVQRRIFEGMVRRAGRA